MLFGEPEWKVLPEAEKTEDSFFRFGGGGEESL